MGIDEQRFRRLLDEINQLAATNRDFNDMLDGLQQRRNTAVRELEYVADQATRTLLARPVAPRLLHGACPAGQRGVAPGADRTAETAHPAAG